MNASFQYVALDSSGSRVEGEIAARSRAEAVGLLGRKMLQPVKLLPIGDCRPPIETQAAAGGTSTIGNRKSAIENFNAGDLISFTEELADLLDAGLQLDPALKIMESKDGASRVGRTASRVREKVREGTRLSQALPAVSKRFDGLYTNLVAAGEAGGALGVILRKQAEYLTVMRELRAKVLQALIYPSFVFAAGILLMVVFMTVLVPQLSMLFSKSERGMPLPTKILVNLSEFFGGYWWAVVFPLTLAVIGWAAFIATPKGKALFHRFQLRIPLAGPVIEANFFAQLAHTLANLTANGIPLLDALRLFHNATANLHLKRVLGNAAERVGEGAALSRVLARSGAFPPDFTDLVSVGEQTGDLPAALARTAVRFDKVLSVRIQRITALIQPVIIMILAVMVGLFAYSILAGIFQAVSGLRPGG